MRLSVGHEILAFCNIYRTVFPTLLLIMNLGSCSSACKVFLAPFCNAADQM